MKKKSKTTRNPLAYPLYAWGIGIFFVFYLFSQNLGLVVDVEVLYVLVAVVLGTTLLIGMVYAITRQFYKSAAIAAIISLSFLSYGHILNLLPSTLLPSLVLVVMLVLTVLSITFILTYKSKSDLMKRMVLPINVIILVLLLQPTYRIVKYYIKAPAQGALPIQKTDLPPKIKNSTEHPDIYYIILDAYAANAQLMRDYNYDNSDFTNALADRGFFVADKSTSNYPATLASLPTTLNMRYYDDADRSGDPVGDLYHTRLLLSDNLVASQLQALGYTYVYSQSGFTIPSYTADLNIDYYPAGPKYFSYKNPVSVPVCASGCYKQSFINFFQRTTMLQSNTPAPASEAAPYKWSDPQRALAIWAAAPKIAENENATFAFIHIIKPHHPLVFAEDGTILDEPADTKEAWFAQLRFVNRKTLEMIDQIKAKSSVPPIIILQGDHGSALGNLLDSAKNYSYFEILNAYDWPGVPKGTIPADITPVNSFRLLFNTYFGTHYDMLENRHFMIPEGYDNIFDLKEVNVDDIIKNRTVVIDADASQAGEP